MQVLATAFASRNGLPDANNSVATNGCSGFTILRVSGVTVAGVKFFVYFPLFVMVALVSSLAAAVCRIRDS